MRRAIATRPIVDERGNRRTVPAWQAPTTRRTGGLADWLAARRLKEQADA